MHDARTRFGRLSAAGLLVLSCLLPLPAPAAEAEPPSGSAPAGDVLRLGHLGRSIGDIERAVHFYHDLLGTRLAGARQPPPRFFSSQPLIDFVSSPPQTEFRALNMPIPGTSANPGEAPEMVVEVIEFRNIDRHQYLPALQSPGLSTLKLLVRDLDLALAALREDGVLIVSAGGEPVELEPMPGLAGSARAVIVRDPEGYPVELLELRPTPESSAPQDSNIIGAHVSLVVADLDASLDFYRHLIGAGLQTWQEADFREDSALNRLRNTPGAERRLATMLIPGSSTIMELIEYRGIDSSPYRPDVRDIGVGHVAFMVEDMDLMMQRLNERGVSTLGRNGGWYHLGPSTRALYTRDPDGFFLELMENKPPQ